MTNPNTHPTTESRAHVEAVPTQPRSLEQGIYDIVVTLSLSNLCFATSWFATLFDVDFGYYNKLAITNSTLQALLVNELGLAAVFWTIMRLCRRWPSRVFRAVVHIGFLVLLLIPVEFFRRSILEIPDYKVIAAVRHWWVAVGILAAVAFVLRYHFQVARIAAVIVGIFSPMALLTLGKALLVLLGVMSIKQYVGNPPHAAWLPGAETRPRFLWIIFDEMDQGLAFDRRPGWVKLPEFDRLRAECLSATNAYAPAGATLLSLPSLILGKTVASAKPVGPSDLSLTLETGEELPDWSRLPSVFSAAREAGANTALVGWYHPYSRILGASLNLSSWYPYPPFEPSRAEGFSACLARQIRCFLPWIHLRAVFAELFRDQLRDSLTLVTNEQLNLVFLHLAPPHKPGVYLPEQSRFTAFGMPKLTGYFNNLIFADRVLGELRRTMEGAGLWDHTWLLVSSDHWWREAPRPPGQPPDHRVPFLLKPPGSMPARELPELLNTVVTRDLVLAVLNGTVTTQADSEAWLKDHGAASPPQYRPSPAEH